jgi:hypothetical protein
MSTDDDAARAEAERLYGGEDVREVDAANYLRHGFVQGAAWQRAQIAAQRDEVAEALDDYWCGDHLDYQSLDEETDQPFPCCLAARREKADAILAALGVSDTHCCDNCEGVDPASCMTRSDR